MISKEEAIALADKEIDEYLGDGCLTSSVKVSEKSVSYSYRKSHCTYERIIAFDTPSSEFAPGTVCECRDNEDRVFLGFYGNARSDGRHVVWYAKEIDGEFTRGQPCDNVMPLKVYSELENTKRALKKHERALERACRIIVGNKNNPTAPVRERLLIEAEEATR